ncbi:MAG: NUDIX domain-containing protein [Acholeplasmatales bacterium]|nr:NUDIX domain-containing protein [Acholeplasmatales bacterium]
MKINYCPLCGTKTNSIHLGDEDLSLCPKCNKKYPSFNYTCVIIICINEEGNIAVIRQSYGVDRFVLVAGFVKPLEALEDCVKREVNEELGLNASNIRYLESIPMENTENLMCAFVCDVKGFISLSSEVKEIKFVKIDEAIKLLNSATIALKVVKDYARKL